MERYVERLRKALQLVDGERPLASLNPTDVALRESGQRRDFLLRDVARGSRAADIGRNHGGQRGVVFVMYHGVLRAPVPVGLQLS